MNKLTIYGILCRNVTVSYRQEVASLFKVQEKLKARWSSKLNLSSSCFIATKSCVEMACLRLVAFSEHDNMILSIFEIIFICLNIFQ